MNDLQQFPPWLMPLAQWFQSQPVALGLLILMLIDVAAGLVLSLSDRKSTRLNSSH